MDDTLLSRIEDAGLNASAPPQQRWMDGWLLRFSPAKAKRARCINALARGRMPVEEKLRQAAAVFQQAGLPLLLRITRFSEPPSLDADLAARGFTVLDDTHVMARRDLPRADMPALPPGLHWQPLPPAAYAEAVGQMRNSPPAQRSAHAQRLALSPVPYQGFAIQRGTEVLACGQFAREGELAGLYDVCTHLHHRSQGLATLLCERLLSLAAHEGAHVGYLQVEADNHTARNIYRRLGFADGYSYHYRQQA